MAIGLHKLGGFGQVEIFFLENYFGEDRSAMVRWVCPRCREAQRWDTADDTEIDQISAWLDGEGGSIQDTMPDIPAEVREAFVSGICPECWAKMFPDE